MLSALFSVGFPLLIFGSVNGLPPPPGGIETSPSDVPEYSITDISSFDWQSLALALHQEYIELDLFNYGVETFSVEDFEEVGLNSDDRALLQFMAQQEVGHAKAITNILGPQAPSACSYTYNFTTLPEYIDFSQKLTRWGESGVYGFLEHLESRASAQILLQSITTEARQQMIFRQFEGLFPMPVWFEVGITQSMAWTLLAPYITSCPSNNTHLMWQNFPALYIDDQPTTYLDDDDQPGISNTNKTRDLTKAGDQVNLSWDAPGNQVGPDENGIYTTSTNVNNTGGQLYVAWFQQLNTTFTELNTTSNSTGYTFQPGITVFEGEPNPIVNDTTFIAIVDSVTPSLGLTPFNISLVNDHIIAGPAVYVAG